MLNIFTMHVLGTALMWSSAACPDGSFGASHRVAIWLAGFIIFLTAPLWDSRSEHEKVLAQMKATDRAIYKAVRKMKK